MELAIIGCGVWIVLAFRARRIPAYSAWQETDQRFVLTFSRRRGIALFLAVLILAGATWIGQSVVFPGSAFLILIAWAVGTALGAVALTGRQAWRTSGQELHASWQSDRAAWLWIGALTLLALAARIISLETFPSLLSIDEAEFSDMARQIASAWQENPFGNGWYQHPLGMPTLEAFSLSLFGRSLFALRLPTAILGALNVPALYLLARELFGPRVARWSALALAVLPVHLLFSRMGLNQVGDTFGVVLGAYFCLRAWRTGKPIDYVLIGLSLGFAQFFYVGGLLGTLILVAFAVFVASRRPGLIRRQADGFVLAMAAFLLITLPYHGHLLLNGQPLLPRSDYYLDGTQLMGIGPYVESFRVSPQVFVEYTGSRLRDAYLAYVTIPDRGRYGGGPLSLAGVFPLVPFVLGALIALRRWRDPRYTLILLFLLIPPLPTLITQPVPDYFRYVLTLPFVCLGVGLGICAVLDVLPASAGWKRRALIALLAIALAAEPLVYFSMWNGGRGSRALLANRLYNAIGRDINTLPLTIPIYFVFPTGLSPHESPVVRLLVDPEHSRHYATLIDAPYHLPVIPCNEQAVFFIGPGYLDSLHIFQEMYPRGLPQWREVEGDARYIRYDVYECAGEN